MTLVVPVLAGIGSLWAQKNIPAMLGATFSTGILKYVAKIGVAFGGQLLIKKFARNNAASNAWAIVAGVQIAGEALGEFAGVNLPVIGMAGVGNYAKEISYGNYRTGIAGMGAYVAADPSANVGNPY